MNKSRRLVALALLLSSVAAALGAAPASAATQRVFVIKVNDGDTFDVSAKRDGTTDYKVRMIGINTPEGRWNKGSWSGVCHSKRAHDRLEGLIEGKWVDLRAASLSSTGADNRKLRYVHRISDGLDINALMLRESLAVAYPSNVEPGRNTSYNRIARKAATASPKRGIWKPTACGWGPHQNARLTVRVRSYVPATTNAATNADLKKEYVRIENGSDTKISLSGWVLRDSSSFYYPFGRGAELAPKGSVTVHTGKGSASGRTHKHYYWNKTASIFGQERFGIRSRKDASRPGFRETLPSLGDGAYLYDRHRDIRAYMSYPCVTAGGGTCADTKIDGSDVDIKVNYAANASGGNATLNQETVSITNTSGAPLDLTGYMLDSWPWNYEFRRYPKTELPAGETLVVHSGTGTPSASGLSQFWGMVGTDIFWCDGDPYRNDYLELRRMEGHVAERWQCSP